MIGNFLRGYIDGSLSTLGIVIGASSAGSSLIIAAAVGGTIANGIANVLSASSAARAESHRELRDVEKAMVSKDLAGTIADKRIEKQSFIAGIADGIATIIGGAVPVIPFALLDSEKAIWTSIGLVVISVIIIGVYLGKIAKRNLYLSALKMAIFAISVAAAVYFIQKIIV